MWTPPLTSVPGFYYVAMDFGGHGLSSHYSPGIQYHMESFVSEVRRVTAGEEQAVCVLGGRGSPSTGDSQWGAVVMSHSGLA